MRPVNGGTSNAKANTGWRSIARKTKSRAGSRQTRLMRMASIVRLASVELNLRRLRHRLFIRYGEVRFFFQMENQLGRQVGRKVSNHLIVLGYTVDVAFAGDRNAIFRSFQLTLEIAEVLIGFQIRIVLRDGNEATQGGSQTGLSFLELFEGCRIL